MTDRDSIKQQMAELTSIKAMLLADPCMQEFWTPSYYEGDQNLKDTMSRFVNLQYNRGRVRTSLIADIDKRLEIMRYVID